MSSKSERESTQQLEAIGKPATHLDTTSNPTARPIWEQIVEISAQVPVEEWEKVPRDLSKNLKHYLYGGSQDDE